jgi:hypothetical protein
MAQQVVTLFRLAALLAVASAATACASRATESVSGPDPHLEYALEIALTDGDASPEQLAALEAAVASGSITFEDYQAAIESALACMNDAGLITDGPYPDDSWGFPRLSYAVLTGDLQHSVEEGEDDTVSPSAASRAEQSSEPLGSGDSDGTSPKERLAQDCRDRHSAFLELAYSEQPSSLQAQDEYLESRRAGILTCADGAGIALDRDLPIRELLAQLIEVGEPGRQCLVENDITAF